MKRFMVIATAVAWIALLSLTATPVHAQSYPNHSIQLIIPIPAGGGGDVNGRILADELGKILGQQIVVTNKPAPQTPWGRMPWPRAKRTAIRSDIRAQLQWFIPGQPIRRPFPMIRSKTSTLWPSIPSPSGGGRTGQLAVEDV